MEWNLKYIVENKGFHSLVKFTQPTTSYNYVLVMHCFRKLYKLLTGQHLTIPMFTNCLHWILLWKCFLYRFNFKPENESKYWRKHFNFRIMFAAGHRLQPKCIYNSVTVKCVAINIEVFSFHSMSFFIKPNRYLFGTTVSNRWYNYCMVKNIIFFHRRFYKRFYMSAYFRRISVHSFLHHT